MRPARLRPPWMYRGAALCICGQTYDRRWHGVLTHGRYGRKKHREHMAHVRVAVADFRIDQAEAELMKKV